MPSDLRSTTSYNNIQIPNRHDVVVEDYDQSQDSGQFRDIHALSPAHPPAPSSSSSSSVIPNSNNSRRTLRRRQLVDGWETSSHRSSSLSISSDATANTDNFTTISREFSALVLAGSTLPRTSPTTPTHNHQAGGGEDHNLGIIGEEDSDDHQLVDRGLISSTNLELDSNPLAIVPDGSSSSPLGPYPAQREPISAPQHGGVGGGGGRVGGGGAVVVGSVQRVKKEEVDAKISAWQNAKVAKVNNRFKREDAVINGWENEQVQKATSWMKKVERKLEEKRVRAMEKMQNDIAKAKRKAEERRATAESKRGTKVARILEAANLARAVGRPPSKRSFLFF